MRRSSRGSMSVEVVVLVPTLFLLVLLAVGRGREFDARIMVQGAADVAARAASVSSLRTMEENGERAGFRFVRMSGIECGRVEVVIDRVRVGRLEHARSRVECTIDNRDLGGVTSRTIRMSAESDEVIDWYRSDR